MHIAYRRLVEDDLETFINMRITQLREEGATEKLNLIPALMDYYHRHMADGTFVSWLAVDGDKIIGTSGMSFVEKPPYFSCPSGKIGLLSSMYTDPDYRRRGIAKELLRRVVEEARDYGCGSVQITASDMGVLLYGRRKTEMDFQAIIVDFDRTLLHTDKTISDYTVKVLLDLQKSGVRLFAATARPERTITEYCEIIPFDAVTTLNGARTISGENVFENPMNTHSAEEILRQLDSIAGTVISLETGNGLYANTDIPIWKPTVTNNILDLPGTEKIYKILASHPEMPAEQINVKLPEDAYISVADQKLIQVMSVSATKWNGIQKMLESYDITPDQAIYFGDDNDDIEPIRRCGCGVAVSNALECVRDVADYITESNDEDGVAKFLTGLVQSI